MKKQFKSLLLSLVMVLAISSFAVSSGGVQAGEEVTILFTHDIHDHFYPSELERDGRLEEIGGFARMKTAIEKEREKDEDLILVDAGDYSMGTLFQTIFESHSPSLRMMGRLGFDATTFGNHEFDFRAEGLAASLESALASEDPLPEIVASNMIFPEDEKGELTEEVKYLKAAMEDYSVEDYLIIEKSGIKIGLLGLMGEDADSNAPMSGLEFENIVTRSKQIVDQLEGEGVDLILALSHTGTEGERGKTEDEILAKEVPEIDVIISGHSHTELKEPIIIGKTIIGSAGRYGENLGRIKISRLEDGTWKLEDYSLLEINEDYQPDSEIADFIEDLKEDVEKEYLSNFNMEFDQVLAYSPFSFPPSHEMTGKHEEYSLGNLISDSYIAAVKKAEGDEYKKVDVAITPAGVIRDSFIEGDITVSDVFNVSSLGIGRDRLSGYPLIDVYLTGKELKTAAEVDASIQPIMPAAQLYASGINISFNPSRMILDKVTDVYLTGDDGQPIEIKDDELYRVVSGLYSAQMLSVVGEKSFNILSIVPKNEDGSPISDFESRIIYEDGHEVKEWLALAEYLQSFPEEDSKPRISEYYKETQSRKTIEDDRSLGARFKNPNKIAKIIYGLIALLVAALSGLLVFIAKKRNKRKN